MAKDIETKVIKAKKASIELSDVSEEVKNRALEAMAEALDRERKSILEANVKDLEYAAGLKTAGKLTQALVDRLKVTDSKVDGMIAGIRDVIRLKDPVGDTLSTLELDNDLVLYQVSCPIGLIGVIFESRPDVVPQVMSLCLKSGNATIFKGGSEARESNRTIFEILVKAIESTEGMPKGAFQLMETREEIMSLLSLDAYVDLLIPRGSNEFVKFIQDNTKIPVLGHTSGICHIYVDEFADLDTAWKVCFDAKVQYPAVCNAIETLLINRGIAEAFLPKMAEMYIEAGVQLRCDEDSYSLLAEKGLSPLSKATEEDWSLEYNDLILSIKLVDTIKEAIGHINTFGSHHTDGIITENASRRKEFIGLVDSSSVMVNASTRFADGYRYGKGAEVGISTNKIHSRGPVGMEGLLIYKYILMGKGQVVADYAGENAKPYTHRKLDLKFKDVN
ncbi:gamma-glutamyl phosphate reductase [Methanosarcina sp. 2.H.T.1A.6]|uniref:glutamate-5-semialdehyde dehydrogenase n=1 Tax=unclassified Methanosarcina TaxID=2644672 RepID=UPI000621A22D|nr:MULTISPECIES: glutamate-5-semialdehyde dehydrogenase [unclassified Methanosarcina]KKG13256.1 gamma-glutamyl phosphate reductase [Methanosarcina sp. 2.H.T.1A.15]KKG15431.1 gamma-glutamyl phosphate reductase [Methanosarcina sp. 2.H.T.1A.3]KKG24780.1 gamma-glutamyl phosphate reductase [Methanosarcina sp. 2.H.T.1A.6]KKG26103.1 gamma-glutamyl phosphate reductase [Methanosarcina sp. 2.H.T.1A.8]